MMIEKKTIFSSRAKFDEIKWKLNFNNGLFGKLNKVNDNRCVLKRIEFGCYVF